MDYYDEIGDLQWHAPFTVKITGSYVGADARTYYEAAEQIVETSDGSLVDLEGGRVFVEDDGSPLLCERNDLVVTASGGAPVYAEARYRGEYEDRGIYDFDAPAESAAATILVEEVDGAPALSGVGKITLDSDDGFRLSEPAAGTARIDIAPASATETGVITTGPQVIGTTASSKEAAVWVAGGLAMGSVGFPGDPFTAPSGAAVYATVSASGPGAGGDNYAAIAARDGASGDHAILYVGSDGVALFEGGATPRYGVRYGATDYLGDYGTDAIGNVFNGGLCTTVGSGTAGPGSFGLSDPNADRILFWDESAGAGGAFGWLEAGTGLTIVGTVIQATGGWSYDEQAQDAVGGILDDTATVALHYDDGLASITAGVVADSLTAGYLHASAASVLFGRGAGAGAGPGEEITLGTGLTMSGTVLSVSGSFPRWTNVTKTHSNFQTGSTTTDIELMSLPAGAVLHAVWIETTTAFAGTGITNYNFDVGKTGNLTKYVSLYSGTAAPSGTNFATQSSFAGLPTPENRTSATSIRIQATSSGANLNASTAGSVTVHILWSQP